MQPPRRKREGFFAFGFGAEGEFTQFVYLCAGATRKCKDLCGLYVVYTNNDKLAKKNIALVLTLSARFVILKDVRALPDELKTRYKKGRRKRN